MLNILFLRLYGLNLERGFRNSPEQACNDALMQMSMILIVPVAVILGLLIGFVPNISDRVGHSDAPIAIAVLMFVVPIVYWVGKQFGHYKDAPSAANAYRSPRARRWTLVSFVLFPVLAAAAVGFIGYLLKAHA